MIRFVIFCRLKSAELTGNWPFSITLTRTRQAVHVIESIDIDTATALVYMQSPDAHEKFLEITTAYDVRATKLVSLHSWKHTVVASTMRMYTYTNQFYTPCPKPTYYAKCMNFVNCVFPYHAMFPQEMYRATV